MNKRNAIASVFGSHPAAGSTADAILAALTAAGCAVEQGWRTMDTAPRDGTRFHGWFPAHGSIPGCVADVSWHHGCWHHPHFVEPTHWRPLPAPPVGEVK